MRGRQVLSPFGFDAFGLPAENAAIKTGEHPSQYTAARIEEFRQSVIDLGLLFDWSREVQTNSEEYTRWNQWIFKRMYEAGLAYRAEAPVNWCGGCQTVLANEQVLADGSCERSGDAVEQKNLKQWFLRSTAYADELLSGLEELDWPEPIKSAQRNWIGKSEGLEIAFELEQDRGAAEPLVVFSTRPDSIEAVSFLAIAAEHPRLTELADGQDGEVAIAVAERVSKLRERDRIVGSQDGSSDRSAFLGRHAINPITQERVPVFVADFVLPNGVSAVMGLPHEDARDMALARQHGLEAARPVEAAARFDDRTVVGARLAADSDQRDPVGVSDDTLSPGEALINSGLAWQSTQYRMRDWLVSRQRYWGTPMPVVYCEKDGPVLVPDDQLPVLLPQDVEFLPTGESPLATAEEFVETSCPDCGGPGRRETDTLDTFVDSSWYFLRYAAEPVGTDAPFNKEQLEKWMPVDWYIGGAEHATMHLLYARFFTKALADLGIIPSDMREPFSKLFNQGTITLDGQKMSKSKGNLVRPEEIVSDVGADALRLYLLGVTGPADKLDWTDAGMAGPVRFLDRLRKVAVRVDGLAPSDTAIEKRDTDMRRELHKAIETINGHYDAFQLHNVVAAQQTLLRSIERYLSAPDTSPNQEVAREALESLIKLSNPLAPHVTAEIAEQMFDIDLLHASWPEHDPRLTVDLEQTLVVQHNGKFVARVALPAGADRSGALAEVAGIERLTRRLGGSVEEWLRVNGDDRVIERPGLLNFVGRSLEVEGIERTTETTRSIENKQSIDNTFGLGL